MNKKYYNLDKLDSDMNYRWVQPPQISYFVSTIDEYGNSNLTPVTLGTCVGANYPRNGIPSEYYFAFSLGCTDIKEEGNKIEVRDGYINLKKHRECVIGYIGNELKRESIISAMPIPRGISEIDVSGLTPLESKKVEPKGIKECPVNMEAKVISSQKLGHYLYFFVCKIIGVSVDKEYIENDNGTGVYAIDPLFEVDIRKNENGNKRLYYGRMDDNIEETTDDFGCKGDWIGTFEKWIKDETRRGKISEDKAQKILNLYQKWDKNRDPIKNSHIKEKLTKELRKIVK